MALQPAARLEADPALGRPLERARAPVGEGEDRLGDRRLEEIDDPGQWLPVQRSAEIVAEVLVQRLKGAGKLEPASAGEGSPVSSFQEGWSQSLIPPTAAVLRLSSIPAQRSERRVRRREIGASASGGIPQITRSKSRPRRRRIASTSGASGDSKSSAWTSG